ncbi:GNAT family N-acetyltransferase [Candidatus Parvarchaeota archaeon]|nr:GNAT family N-acetyltransferase [Candidatus Parvarchaeota archaeon]
MPKERVEPGSVLIETIRPEHASLVESFCCGREDEDSFLKKDALKNKNAGLSDTFLLLKKDKTKIISYLTLVIGSFKLSESSTIKGIKIRDKDFHIYTDKIPCLLIGKLATDKEETGRGGASYLISFAIEKAVQINKTLSLPYLALHTYPENVEFYAKFGFSVAFTPERKDAETITLFMTLTDFLEK